LGQTTISTYGVNFNITHYFLEDISPSHVYNWNNAYYMRKIKPLIYIKLCEVNILEFTQKLILSFAAIVASCK
jgi:hypothetical protein